MENSIATSVRRARPSDTAALTDLVNRAYAIESAFLDGERTTSEEIARLIESGGFLVLEYAGGLCGAVLVQGAPSSQAYFGMLSVLPELQGRGLGLRLVRVAEAMAEATGATSMSLRIINLREELHRWYRSLGYREVGTTPYTYRGMKRPFHFIEMAKPLAQPGERSPIRMTTRMAAGEVGAA